MRCILYEESAELAVTLAMVVGALLPTASCSHTASVQPSPTITIAITAAPDVLLVGDSALLTAVNAVTGETVNAQWSTSNRAVASASDATLLAVGAGRVTITASYQGATATVSVKVVPIYAGTYPAPPDIWGFIYKIACVDLTGNFCRSNISDAEFFRMQINQVKDVVSARCVTTYVDGVLSGEIDDAGRLTLRGTLPSLSGGGFPGFPSERIESWSTYLDASGAMYGTFTSQFLARDGTANFQVTQEIRGISHAR